MITLQSLYFSFHSFPLLYKCAFASFLLSTIIKMHEIDTMIDSSIYNSYQNK